MWNSNPKQHVSITQTVVFDISFLILKEVTSKLTSTVPEKKKFQRTVSIWTILGDSKKGGYTNSTNQQTKLIEKT